MRKLRTEEAIIASWKGDVKMPVVSICCITYNHELYLEDALEGFLIQETDFPFEILIHDDASTDCTANIIREYEAKYPRLIKSIYQTENQYSKGFKMNPSFNFPRAKGEFIAMCEGDDFWTDNRKLQCQVEQMKFHNVNMSFHPATEMVGEKLNNHNRNYHNRIYHLDEMLGNGFHFVQTNTTMFRINSLLSIPDEILKISPVGDVLQRIWGSYETGAICINKCMSVYRVQTPGSWSSQNEDCLRKSRFIFKMFDTIELIKNYMPDRFNKTFDHYYISFMVSLIECKLKNEQNSEQVFTMAYNNLSVRLKLYIQSKIILSRLKLLVRPFLKS